MRPRLRNLGYLFLGSLLIINTASAQSPTVEALLDQIAQLKKQLTAERTRAEELAARAEAEAQAARQAELEARRQAELARAQAEEALRRAQQQPNAPQPNPAPPPRPGTKPGPNPAEKAEMIAVARARIEAIEAILFKLNENLAALKKAVIVNPVEVARTQAEIAVTQKELELERLRLAELQAAIAPVDNEVDRLRRELEETRRALAENRALAARLADQLARAEAQGANDPDRRALSDRVKLLEQRMTEVEKLLKQRP